MKMILTENRGEFMSCIIFTLNSSPPSSTLYFIYNFRYVFFAAVGWLSHCRCSMSLKSSSLSFGVVIFPCVSSLVLARWTSSAKKREWIDFFVSYRFVRSSSSYRHYHRHFIIMNIVDGKPKIRLDVEMENGKVFTISIGSFFHFSLLYCCHCRCFCLLENFFSSFFCLSADKKRLWKRKRHEDNENFYHVLITRHFDGEDKFTRFFPTPFFVCMFSSASRLILAVVIVYSNSLNFRSSPPIHLLNDGPAASQSCSITQ